MSIKIQLKLELVESLVAVSSEYCGHVLLTELQTTMEVYLQRGLERGVPVTLVAAFDYAWQQLVVVSPDTMIMSELMSDD